MCGFESRLLGFSFESMAAWMDMLPTHRVVSGDGDGWECTQFKAKETANLSILSKYREQLIEKKRVWCKPDLSNPTLARGFFGIHLLDVRFFVPPFGIEETRT